MIQRDGFSEKLAKEKMQIDQDGLPDDIAAMVILDFMGPRIADQMRSSSLGHRIHVRPAEWLSDREFCGVVSSFPPLHFPYCWLAAVCCKLDPLQGWVVAGPATDTPRLVAVQLFVAQENARAYAAAGGPA